MKKQKKIWSTLHINSILWIMALPMASYAGEEILRSNEALQGYKNEYSAAKENKAFAQSPDGTWAWRSDRTSAQLAQEDAIKACNSYLKEKGKPCLVVNINGKWINQ